MQINFKFYYKKKRKKIYNDFNIFDYILTIYHSDFFIIIKDILYIYRILSFCVSSVRNSFFMEGTDNFFKIQKFYERGHN